jgi:hypothetical protein
MKRYIAFLLITFAFSSCLKNGNYYTNFAAVNASVDLPLAAANSNGVVSFTYAGSVNSAQIPFYINLASPSPLNTAVTATFSIDTAYFNTYNANNGGIYTLMPSAAYTVVNGWSRTIPAGKRLDSMYVSFDFTQLNPNNSYVLPITISQASIPIEQWNHLMINPSN